MRIVADDKIPFLRGVLEPYAEVVYMPGAEITAAHVRHARALITRTRTRCCKELLEGSQVEFIATATIGYDHIDTEWCAERGIHWTNAAGCNSSSVMQYVTALIVSAARDRKFDLSQTTVGVVGVGHIGEKVVAAARALGCRTLFYDPYHAFAEGEEGFVSLDTIIEEAQIITLHVPLTREGNHSTYHLFDFNRLGKLRKEQILINTSRGEVVCQEALLQVLRKGVLTTAALDVWENEPDVSAELAQLLYCATPHIAGYSVDGKACGTTMTVQAVARHFNLPLHEWRVEELPHPSNSLEFQIDAQGKSLQEVMTEAVLYTYNPLADSSRLRENLCAFEALRAAYPVRREFSAYKVNLINAPASYHKRLQELQFITY